MKKFTLTALILIGAVTIKPMQAAELTADEIINRANYISYYQGQDGRAQVTMTITDSQNRERSRKMTILRRDVAETDDLAGNAYRSGQQFYVYFHRPSDVSKWYSWS